MVGPKTARGKRALALAALGGVLLLVSAVESWVVPARVAWPSYTDGVPDFITRPSDLAYRVGAALVGIAALVVVAHARRGRTDRLSWAALGLLGLGGIALGAGGFTSVESYRGFGSMVANDMTLHGFRHGLFNYAELFGAALVLASPITALKARR
jgi:lysylphosphatidylglycerol synthetase-like protein (DUF2156 family)